MEEQKRRTLICDCTPPSLETESGRWDPVYFVHYGTEREHAILILFVFLIKDENNRHSQRKQNKRKSL